MIAEHQPAKHRRRFDRALFGIAAVTCLAVLATVLGNELVWDDRLLIVNGRGFGDLDLLPDALMMPFWHNSTYVGGTHPGYWRPLTTLVLWLGAAIWDDWPSGFHLLSLLAACGAAAMFALVVGRLLHRGQALVAWWVALLLLAHPLCAEVICMAANVSDHLALVFVCLAVLLFLEETRSRSLLRIALASGAIFCACCSKEIGVLAAGAPIAAWLFRRWREPSHPVRSLARSAVWIATLLPVGLYLALRYAVNATSDTPGYSPSLGEFAWAVFLGVGQLFRSVSVPVPAGALTTIGPGAVIPLLVSAASLCLLIAVAFWHLLRLRNWTRVAIGLVLALALFIPSMLAPVRTSDGDLGLATRFFHVPMAGLLIALLPAVDRGWNRGLRWVAPLLVCLLALLSYVRIGEWRSDVEFFAAESRYHPESPSDLINYARALSHARAYDEVEKVLQRLGQLPTATDPAIRSKALNDWAALALLRDGDHDRATALLEESLKLDPTNLANVLDLASVRNVAGHPEQSSIILRKAKGAPWFQDYRKREILEKLEHYERLAAERRSSAR